MSEARDGIPSSPSSVEDDSRGEIRQPGWVAESDGYARPILDLAADFEPENFGPLGVPGAEEKITRLPPDWPREKLIAYARAIRTLDESRAREGHAAVRLDLESMSMFLRWEHDYRRIDSELMLPCPNLAQTVVQGLLMLLADRTQEHRAPAVRRLRGGMWGSKRVTVRWHNKPKP